MPLVEEEKSCGFKTLFLPFSLILCLTDGKSGAENCFAQSHTLAVIELLDSIGFNRKCAIDSYYYIQAVLTAVFFSCPHIPFTFQL